MFSAKPSMPDAAAWEMSFAQSLWVYEPALPTYAWVSISSYDRVQREQPLTIKWAKTLFA